MFNNRRTLFVCLLAWTVMVFGGTVTGATVSASVSAPAVRHDSAVVVFDRMAPVKTPADKMRAVFSKTLSDRTIVGQKDPSLAPSVNMEPNDDPSAGNPAEASEAVYDAWLSSEPEVQTPSYDGGGYVDANVDGTWISGSDFAWMGVHYDSGSGYSYTYYSENVLPGGGLSIPGRHVGDEGYVMDGNGNLCLASDDLPYGTVVSVPFGSGTGVVYDCGSGYGNLDVYVSW